MFFATQFQAPVSGDGNRRLLSGARNHDIHSRQMIPAEKKTKMDSDFTKIRFSYCSMSWKNCRHSTSSFIFVYKQTSSAIVCSDWPITVQLSRRFPARNRTCCNRRQNLAAEKSGTRKVWQTDQFLVPVNWYKKQASETGQCVITFIHYELIPLQIVSYLLVVNHAQIAWTTPSFALWRLTAAENYETNTKTS